MIDSIEINGVNLTEDILVSLEGFQNDDENMYLNLIEILYEEMINYNGDEDFKYEAIQKITFLRYFIEKLTDRKEKPENPFRNREKHKRKDLNADDTVQHFKDNKEFYLDRIEDLSDALIHEGMEQMYDDRLYEWLQIFVNIRKLISSL